MRSYRFREYWEIVSRIWAACLLGIFALGLGSERVRTVVRRALPASLGGVRGPSADLFPEVVPEEEGRKEKDPDALPEHPKEESLRGIVRDAAGKPVAGATVSAERWRKSRWEVLAETRTNRDGEFVLGPLPKAHLSAVARAPGYASERKPARTGSRLEFNLKSGGTLLLKVVDAVTGEPVKECYVSGWSQRGDWYEAGRTDAKGESRYLSVPPGRLWMEIVPPEHRRVNLEDIEVFEGKETVKEIPVVKGGMLKGRVLDAETKVPVAQANIRTWDEAKSAVSGEDGKYEIPSPSGQWGLSLRVSAPGYPEQWQWLQIQGDPSQDVEKDIEIGKGGKVTGVVLRPDGSPAAGARVGRDPGDLMTGVPEDTATADAEGRFVLEAVPAMRGGRLFAVAEGFALSRSDPLEVRSGSEVSIRILLQSGAAFKGTVKDEDGEPLAGVSFQLERQWSPQDGGGWFWIPELVGYSLADGTWEIPSVPGGTYSVRVNLEGYAPESRGSLVAPPEGELAGLDFLLRKGSSITGRVRNLAGDLLPGVSVTAWGWVMGSEGQNEWVQRAEVRSNDEGFFVMDGLRDGAYTLNFVATGYAPLSRAGIVAGTRELQVTVLPTARLEGRVFEPDGTTPVANFTLKLVMEVAADGTPQGPGNIVNQQDFADREGKFVLHDVPEGQVGLVAVAGNKISTRLGNLVVGPGTVIENLRLVLSLGGRLKVSVRDAAGQPLEGASVSAGRATPDGGWTSEYWSQTDNEGVAMFAAMADGNWVIWADYQNRMNTTRRVNVGGGVEAEMELVLTTGGSVLVHAVDGEGKPVEGAAASFVNAATGEEIQLNWGLLWQKAWERSGGRNLDWQKVQREATQTDAEGRLLREGIPAGQVVVTLRRQGMKDATARVAVFDGYEVDLRIPMEGTSPPPAPEAPPPPGDGGGGVGEEEW